MNEGYEPITAELRGVMNHTTMAGVPLVELGEYEFGHRCDAIDAVHASLERENAELRERLAVLDKSDDTMHDDWVRKNKEHVISRATIEVTPHIDWLRMADELDKFVGIVRGMAGGAE